MATPTLANPPSLKEARSLFACDDNENPTVLPCSDGQDQFEKPTAVDLNADGQMEWIFVSNRCGAAMNCPAYIIQKTPEGWRLIFRGGGRVLEMLPSQHKGYKDLLENGHNSACVGDYITYVWNGQDYRDSKTVSCDYCAEKKGKKLPKVCNRAFTNTLFCTVCEE